MNYGGALAWIGMVLVDPQFRRMGIGTLLLQQAIDYLEQLEPQPLIALDATPAGKELYDTLGFRDVGRVQRWVHSCMPALSEEPAGVMPLTLEVLEAILHKDREFFGADRSALLHALLEKSPATAWCIERQEQIQGYCLGRRGTNFHQIGPLIAHSSEDAVALAQAAFRSLSGHAAMLDVPEGHDDFIAWLQKLGFVRQRDLIRMARGQAEAVKLSQHLAAHFAITGPEFG